MMDFTQSDLLLRVTYAERDRQARAIAARRDSEAPRGLRAALAARLAHMALHLDRETAGSLVRRHFGTAGRG